MTDTMNSISEAAPFDYGRRPMDTERLRIVHVVSSLQGGGMEHFVLRLATPYSPSICPAWSARISLAICRLENASGGRV